MVAEVHGKSHENGWELRAPLFLGKLHMFTCWWNCKLKCFPQRLRTYSHIRQLWTHQSTSSEGICQIKQIGGHRCHCHLPTEPALSRSLSDDARVTIGIPLMAPSGWTFMEYTMGDLQDPEKKVRSYHMFSNILWGNSLKHGQKHRPYVW